MGTIGATAPFVGLFGTVVGIMSAMSGFTGEDVKFADVAGPISEALVVTAAGILVAVEAVILFNYFSQRAARINTEMKLLADEFLENLAEHEADAVATRPRKSKADKADKAVKTDAKDDDGDR